MNSLHFGGEWSPLAGFGLAALLAAAAFLLYRRETRGHANRLSRVLPWLRAGAVFLVVLMLCGPVIRHRRMQGTLTRLFFCVDGSESMGLLDSDLEPERKEAVARALGWYPPVRPGGNAAEEGRETASALARFDRTTRTERVRSLLTEGAGEGLLAALAGRFDIQLVALENSGIRLLWQSGEGLEKLPLNWPDPAGVSTDLLSSGLRQTVSPPVDTGGGSGAPGGGEAQSTAVVLFSDGQHNTQSAPIALAKELGDRRIPVYALGYGKTTSPPDMAMVSVEAPETVFFEDRVSGTLVLRDEMPPGEEYRVKVESRGKVVWEKTLVTARRHLVRLPFDFAVSELVREAQGAASATERRTVVPLSFQASIVPVSGEREVRNNASDFLVRATTLKRRILLLDGRPRWDTLYVRNLFERDTRWQVNALLLGGADVSERWPRGDKAGMFPSSRELLNEYDAVVLGDLPQRALTETEWEWLTDYVGKRGGGLLFVDGQRRHLAAHVTGSPGSVGALLPVEFPGGDTGQTVPEGHLELTERGRSLGVFALDPGPGDPAAVWRQLRPPQWLSRVRALPGSETLLELAGPAGRQPALVWRQFGAGRVGYLGFDETWRWRSDVAEKFQDRFWNQLLPALAEPVFAAGDEKLSLDTDRFKYPVGGIAEIRVRAREALRERVAGRELRAVLWRDGQRVATVALSAEREGSDLLRGRTAPLESGAYWVAVESAKGEGELPLRVSFEVGSQAVGELAELSLNEELLKRVAEESGGKYLREEFGSQLKEMLSALETGRVVVTETVLWQSYWWFSAVLLLLSLEWILRKRLGLV